MRDREVRLIDQYEPPWNIQNPVGRQRAEWIAQRDKWTAQRDQALEDLEEVGHRPRCAPDRRHLPMR